MCKRSARDRGACSLPPLSLSLQKLVILLRFLQHGDSSINHSPALQGDWRVSVSDSQLCACCSPSVLPPPSSPPLQLYRSESRRLTDLWLSGAEQTICTEQIQSTSVYTGGRIWGVSRSWHNSCHSTVHNTNILPLLMIEHVWYEMCSHPRCHGALKPDEIVIWSAGAYKVDWEKSQQIETCTAFL